MRLTAVRNLTCCLLLAGAGLLALPGCGDQEPVDAMDSMTTPANDLPASDVSAPAPEAHVHDESEPGHVHDASEADHVHTDEMTTETAQQ